MVGIFTTVRRLQHEIKIHYYAFLKAEAESLQEPYGSLGSVRDFKAEVNKPPFDQACYAKNATTIFESPLLKTLRLPFRKSKINTERYQNLAFEQFAVRETYLTPGVSQA